MWFHVAIWKQKHLRLFHQKVWTTRQSNSSYKNCQPWPSQSSPCLQEPITRCEQMWNNWEQLGFVVHSPLTGGMTLALIISLGTCSVQTQSVWVNFACTKRLFNLSAEASIIVHNAHACARCAIFVLNFSQNLFLDVWSRSLHFWR